MVLVGGCGCGGSSGWVGDICGDGKRGWKGCCVGN